MVAAAFAACGGSETPPPPPPATSASAALPPPVAEPDWYGLAALPPDHKLDGKNNEWSGAPKKGWLFAGRERVVLAVKLDGAGASWTLRLHLGKRYSAKSKMFVDGRAVTSPCGAFQGASEKACMASVDKQDLLIDPLEKATEREYAITAGGATVGGAAAPGVKVALTAEIAEIEIPASELPALPSVQIKEAGVLFATPAAAAPDAKGRKPALDLVTFKETVLVGGALAPIAGAALPWLDDTAEAPHPVAAVFEPKGKEPKLRVVTIPKPAAARSPSQAAASKDLSLGGKVELANGRLEVLKLDLLGVGVLAARVNGVVAGAFGMPAQHKLEVMKSAKRGADVDVAWKAGGLIPDSPNVHLGILRVSRFSADGTVHPDHFGFEQPFLGAPTRTVSADLSTLSVSGRAPAAAQGESTPVKMQWKYDAASGQYVEKP